MVIDMTEFMIESIDSPEKQIKNTYKIQKT
jgi:hypothetical protein